MLNDPFGLILVKEPIEFDFDDDNELPFSDKVKESCPMCEAEIKGGYCKICGWTDGNVTWFEDDEDEETLFDEVR